MIMTIYKVHGMAYNYVVAVCEESKTIYFADELSFPEPGIFEDKSINFEDLDLFYIQDYCIVTDWPAYTLEAWAAENGREVNDEAWSDMKSEFVSENGNTDVLETWEDAEVL